MCIQFYICYSCGRKGLHLGHKPCYHTQKIEAYSKPGSRIVLKNPIQYYKECENCSSESYISRNKVCGACKLLAKGLGTVEKEEEEDDKDGDAIGDLERDLGQVEA
jgi:ribosomal protein L37E